MKSSLDRRLAALEAQREGLETTIAIVPIDMQTRAQLGPAIVVQLQAYGSIDYRLAILGLMPPETERLDYPL